MPLLARSAYNPSFLFRRGHLSTIYMGGVKSFKPPKYNRFQLSLSDGDFLWVDYQLRDKKRAVILCHGLEGSSQSSYNNRAAYFILQEGYSVFAWNNRSCGGEMNNTIRLYHHGETEDLAAVVDDVLERGFKEVYLLGYSMGGAQILNYLGRHKVPTEVRAGVAISAPISLESSAKRMEKGLSKIYLKRFINKIKSKVIIKAREYPDVLNINSVRNIKSFEDLAEHFMVPVYGFKDLKDFYNQASPASSIAQINTPVLLLNALDDPIIGEGGFPFKIAEKHSYLYFEAPEHGGHCGFPVKGLDITFSEIRALSFFEDFSSVH